MTFAGILKYVFNGSSFLIKCSTYTDSVTLDTPSVNSG